MSFADLGLHQPTPAEPQGLVAQLVAQFKMQQPPVTEGRWLDYGERHPGSTGQWSKALVGSREVEGTHVAVVQPLAACRRSPHSSRRKETEPPLLPDRAPPPQPPPRTRACFPRHLANTGASTWSPRSPPRSCPWAA